MQHFLIKLKMMRVGSSFQLAIQVMVYGFLTLLTLVSLANIVNHIFANLLQRRRSLAMLQSVGMKRVRHPRNLRVRTLTQWPNPGHHRSRPLTLRFLTGLVHALAETRSQAQKPAHKDLGHKWPKPSHLCPRPLMLRFLTAPAHALETLRRAPGFFKYQEHSVAAHSFKVAEIAQMLGDVEELAGNKVNWQMLYEKSLNHDYTERFIGDIKTPVKYATPTLRHMLADVEATMTENFIKNEIPRDFQDRYRRRLSEGKDETLEGQILSVADKIDLLYEGFGEIEKGNPEQVFLDIYSESLSTILQFRNRPSVRYFLEEVLPDMLDEKFASRDQLAKLTKETMAEHEPNK
jgi:putative hydrolase of HD superfamily